MWTFAMTIDELRKAVRMIEPDARCLTSEYRRHEPTHIRIVAGVGDTRRDLSEICLSHKGAWHSAWEKLGKPQTQAMRKAASKEKQLTLKGT